MLNNRGQLDAFQVIRSISLLQADGTPKGKPEFESLRNTYTKLVTNCKIEAKKLRSLRGEDGLALGPGPPPAGGGAAGGGRRAAGGNWGWMVNLLIRVQNSIQSMPNDPIIGRCQRCNLLLEGAKLYGFVYSSVPNTR